jgi:hypothetical protein
MAIYTKTVGFNLCKYYIFDSKRTKYFMILLMVCKMFKDILKICKL